MTHWKDFDWLFMCRRCKHYDIEIVQADGNAVGCQLKHCRYEPLDDAARFHELEEALSFILKKSQLPKGYYLFKIESEVSECDLGSY